MTELIGIAAVVLVAWFAAGTIWNVHLGRETLRWMQGGLPALAERTTVRWLGSSAVEMVLQDARTPFSGAALVIFLEPRDLPWWPLSRLRGRRDTLIVRGSLRRVPGFELEALDPASWSGREALPRIPPEWPARKNLLHAYGDSGAALELADALLARADGLVVRRLSVRCAEPHFQLHLDLPGRDKPAGEFFRVVLDLAGTAVKSHPPSS